MRYPESKIKDAILHPDDHIRARAATYFGDSPVPDTSVMPLVIRAVETYGRTECDELLSTTPSLAQSDQTIDWALRQLNDEGAGRLESCSKPLSALVAGADLALLRPRLEAVRQARYLIPSQLAALDERLEMAAWDEAACWRELDRFCEESQGEDRYFEADYPHAERVVEALARHGTGSEAKVLDVLGQKFPGDFGPLDLKIPLVMRLAGLLRLEAAIPALVKGLEIEDDHCGDEVGPALAHIGTPAVVDTIAAAYSGMNTSGRMLVGDVFRRIRTDASTAACHRLLLAEEDGDVRFLLEYALLLQFAEAATELVRQDILTSGNTNLRGLLLQNCEIAGVRFPEFDRWSKDLEAQRKEYAKLWGNAQKQRTVRLERSEDTGLGSEPSRPVRFEPPPPPVTPQPLHREARAGRNDPCPCGSGKKFKNCCLKK